MKPAATFLKEAKALVKLGRLTLARDKVTDGLCIYSTSKPLTRYLQYVEDAICYGIVNADIHSR